MNKHILLALCGVLLMGMVLPAGCYDVSPAAWPAIASGIVGPVSSACNKTMLEMPGESLDFSSHFMATELLTRPTDHSVTVSLVPKDDLEILFAYGTSSGSYTCQTPAVSAMAGYAMNVTLEGLLPDTQYYYRTCFRQSGSADYKSGPENTFHTQRSPGSTFTFGIQADSHPERPGKMFDFALYDQTMRNVKEDELDFYITLGDDFSIDKLIEQNQLSRQTVDEVYLNQREYLGYVGSSSPIFLVNGNHEQAARYLLDGTPDNAAVYAGTSRIRFFPQPVPDEFYSGDAQEVEYVGLPADYYAWTWGDALFVVIDPYWHSSSAVDNVIGENGAKKVAKNSARDSSRKRDMWDITLGESQYQWFKKTLEESEASYKLVFAHHVQGTGRGGIENARFYEWGGEDRQGVWQFDIMRPGWELPIHQLMAENGVTIFFQGHDHLFARQELDGVIYQEVPCPADPTYSTFNAQAYSSGIKLPNSGHVRVTVSAKNVTVDYVKSYLPDKETASENNGMVAYSYTVVGDSPVRTEARTEI